MRAPNNGDRPFVILHPQCDLCDRNAAEPIEARCDGGSFSSPHHFRGPVWCQSHGILEDKEGPKGGGGFADLWARHTIHNDVASFVYGLVLEEGEVEGFEPVVVVVVVGGGGRLVWEEEKGKKNKNKIM